MTLKMKRVKQLCDQYQEHLNPPYKPTEELNYLDVFKISIIRELENADNPKQCLEILQEKSGSEYFPEMSKANFLRMNRSSPLYMSLKVLLVLLTFPLSLPSLMYWSFRTRGTINFLKTEGALFIEKLTAFCREWKEDTAISPSNNPLNMLTHPTLTGATAVPAKDKIAIPISIAAKVPREPASQNTDTASAELQPQKDKPGIELTDTKRDQNDTNEAYYLETQNDNNNFFSAFVLAALLPVLPDDAVYDARANELFGKLTRRRSAELDNALRSYALDTTSPALLSQLITRFMRPRLIQYFNSHKELLQPYFDSFESFEAAINAIKTGHSVETEPVCRVLSLWVQHPVRLCIDIDQLASSEPADKDVITILLFNLQFNVLIYPEKLSETILNDFHFALKKARRLSVEETRDQLIMTMSKQYYCSGSNPLFKANEAIVEPVVTAKPASALVRRAPPPDDEAPIELQREEDSDIKNMVQLTSQLVNVFGTPEQQFERKLQQFHGQAMIIRAQPLRPAGKDRPNEMLLEFTYKHMYTHAPLQQCVIRVFKSFTPMPRQAPPLQIEMNPQPPQEQSSYLQRGHLYMTSFFADNFRSMMEKGRINAQKKRHISRSFFKKFNPSDLIISEPELWITPNYYERALALATTDTERLMAIEAIIRSLDDARDKWATKNSEFYAHFDKQAQEKAKVVLQQLPANYRLMSADILHVTAMYQAVWALLEENQLESALTLFESIKLSTFVTETCPELDAMKCQLTAIFKIYPQWGRHYDNAVSATGWFHATFARLSQHAYTLCLMSEYNPLQGAEPGKLYLTPTMKGPLNYVLRNESNTADWVGVITQDEIIENRIYLGYSPGDFRDFIDRLKKQLPRIIPILAERGQACQRYTEEAALLLRYTMKPLGRMQQAAMTAWDRTPSQERRRLALEFDKTAKQSNFWKGYHLSVRVDAPPERMSKQEFIMAQKIGITNPFICYPEDNPVTEETDTDVSLNATSLGR